MMPTPHVEVLNEADLLVVKPSNNSLKPTRLAAAEPLLELPAYLPWSQMGIELGLEVRAFGRYRYQARAERTGSESGRRPMLVPAGALMMMAVVAKVPARFKSPSKEEIDNLVHGAFDADTIPPPSLEYDGLLKL